MGVEAKIGRLPLCLFLLRVLSVIGHCAAQTTLRLLCMFVCSRVRWWTW